LSAGGVGRYELVRMVLMEPREGMLIQPYQ
jgi:hypothetical protein